MHAFLDKRYALALYEIADKKGKLEEFIEDLKAISRIIDETQDFKRLLENPKISKREKKKIFEDMFKDKTYVEIISFIGLLIEKGRLLELDSIIEQFHLIYLDRHSMIEGYVKSVIPLTDDEYDRLLEKLEKKYNKKVILRAEIDKDILGGLYVKVGNEIIDGSLAGKYQAIKSVMVHSK